LDDFYRLYADGDDSLEEIHNIARLVVFFGPVVGVVADATVFVHGDLITLHDPLDGRLAIHDVIVGFQRNAAKREVTVENDRGLVYLFVLPAKRHFARGSPARDPGRGRWRARARDTARRSRSSDASARGRGLPG
jgi:hypothetical protein